MVNRRTLFKECIQRLNAAGIDSPDFELGCIFEDVFNEKYPLLNGECAVSQAEIEKSYELTEKRCTGYPLQYILGEWEFFGYRFFVGEGVLIPRPDTETLVEQVLDICRKKCLDKPVIGDLCSGSGCIAITLEKEIPEAEVYAVEKSRRALEYLSKNTEYHNASVKITAGDVLEQCTVNKLPKLDILVCNPPYLTEDDMKVLQREVKYEPELALYGGTDGLDFYRRLVPLWKGSLKKNGVMLFEFGIDQHEAVKKIMIENNLKNIELRRDLNGIIRTAAGEVED